MHTQVWETVGGVFSSPFVLFQSTSCLGRFMLCFFFLMGWNRSCFFFHNGKREGPDRLASIIGGFFFPSQIVQPSQVRVKKKNKKKQQNEGERKIENHLHKPVHMVFKSFGGFFENCLEVQVMCVCVCFLTGCQSQEWGKCSCVWRDKFQPVER